MSSAVGRLTQGCTKTTRFLDANLAADVGEIATATLGHGHKPYSQEKSRGFRHLTLLPPYISSYSLVFYGEFCQILCVARWRRGFFPMRIRVGFATACVALLALAGLAPASASTITVDGSYTVSYTPIAGNSPTISYNLNHNLFVENLTLGGPATTPVNFFTINPASSCGSTCVGDTEGSHHYYTASGIYTVTFNFSNLTILSGSTLSDTGLYQAKYGGAALDPCALNSGSGDSDCITWSHHAASQSGGSDTLQVNFKQGTTVGILDIILFDAEDWSIKPKISFEAFVCGAGVSCGNQGSTPLPATLPLLGSVLGGGYCFSKWRRKRKNATVAA